MRAGLVNQPQDYAWSSAALHCGATNADDNWIDMRIWRDSLDVHHMEYLKAESSESEERTPFATQLTPAAP